MYSAAKAMAYYNIDSTTWPALAGRCQPRRMACGDPRRADCGQSPLPPTAPSTQRSPSSARRHAQHRCATSPTFRPRCSNSPRCQARDGESVTVAWDAPGGAAATSMYTLQHRADGDAAWTTASTAIKAELARKRNLDPDKRHAFRIRPTPPPDGGGVGGVYAFSRACEPIALPKLAPFWRSTLGGKLVDAKGAQSSVASLAGKIILVLASASW